MFSLLEIEAIEILGIFSIIICVYMELQIQF